MFCALLGNTGPRDLITGSVEEKALWEHYTELTAPDRGSWFRSPIPVTSSGWCLYDRCRRTSGGADPDQRRSWPRLGSGSTALPPETRLPRIGGNCPRSGRQTWSGGKNMIKKKCVTYLSLTATITGLDKIKLYKYKYKDRRRSLMRFVSATTTERIKGVWDQL